MKNPELKLSQPDVYGLIQSLGWIYRFLNIINTPVPKVECQSFFSISILRNSMCDCETEHKTPFLLTEHGIYMREQYLSLSNRNLSPFLNIFLMRFIHSITARNYHYADQVSPVCYYNTRWETKLGVAREKIEVIYNGVDKKVFIEAEKMSVLILQLCLLHVLILLKISSPSLNLQPL